MTNHTEITTRRNFFRAFVLPAVAVAMVAGGATFATAPDAEAKHKSMPPEYFQGYKKGKFQGHKDGYEDGYKNAYKESYNEELNNPTIMMKKFGPDYFVIGYKKGYKVGYSIGFKQGKKAGKLDGKDDAQAMRDDLREEMRKCMEEGICS